MGDIKVALIVGAFLILLVTFSVLMVRQFLFTVRRAEELFQAPRVSKEPESPRNAFVESRLGQRLIGLFLFGIGAFGVFWFWREALRGNEVGYLSAIFFPFATAVGTGNLLFPYDFATQRQRYGRGEARTWEEVPEPMKVFIVLGLCASLINWWALMSR
ncbi:hypothetical protein J8F10_29085 [Gemmata sp. G18]|uniref:DUF3784 domain-containing protein n=1 Tax=Gemmata palustris TaxID=2822762 RepID=A0ABS5C014_9BACT|nr:hypothetical protein [Gemmata palustris]MBP3959319.1 hypothetical protein [Gemmata palustris]